MFAQLTPEGVPKTDPDPVSLGIRRGSVSGSEGGRGQE